jgi:hypothetical protein
MRDREIARVRPIAFPALERERLHFAEPKRRLDCIEADWQVSAAALGPCRFVPNEISLSTDRARRPGHDHAFGGVEMFLDVFAPVRAAADVLVPPDSEAFSFECFNERCYARAVFGLVRQEHIRR